MGRSLRGVPFKIPATCLATVIEGASHAQFGSYGRQKGDPDATISAETQQTVTAEAIDAFIQKNGGST